MSMRIGHLTITPTDISVYTALMFSIDAILVLLLVWAYGGVKHVRRVEFLVFPRRTRDGQQRLRIIESETSDSKQIPQAATTDVDINRSSVTSFEKWLMKAFILSIQILQWIFILWVCSLDNLFLEGLVMTTSFICHGMIISRRNHLKPVVLCTLAATAMFYTAARFSISFQYSQFIHIIIGLILSYTLYLVAIQFEKNAKKELKSELERIKKLESRVDNAWKELERLS